ncbi:hypothetical protein FACS1894147_05960 [Spirochaetia bacterium]|nr:hypothetical protein FACS1894147_05960 [Spirochaetia bacterium]
MIGFLIKKTFFDVWDNLFRVALVNLGFILSVGAFVFLYSVTVEVSPVVSLVVLAVGILWGCVYLSTAAGSLKAVSDYGSFGFADFFRNIKAFWPAGIASGVLIFIAVILATYVLPFYAFMGNLFGLLLAAVVFWTLVVFVLSIQFFFAIRSRLDTKLGKVIKKCFLIFFDNPGLCIFSMIYCLIQLVCSVLLAFLFPGPAGILLYLDEALRLRLLKYDWLEENPDADRRKIPWDALLIDEREKTGTRSLRNFIFPWKD